MRISMVSFRALVLVLVSSSTVAASARAQSKLRGMVRLGGDFGGDKVLQFTYSDGSTPSVTAGSGLLVTVGGALQAFKSGGNEVDAQLDVGMKYRTIPSASNQDATWRRFPVEALVTYRAPIGLSLGAGAAVHLGNVLEASGATLNSRVAFKNNPGFVFQSGYALRSWELDARYTVMKYEVASGGSGSVNANSFGLGLSYWIGGSAGRRATTGARSR